MDGRGSLAGPCRPAIHSALVRAKSGTSDQGTPDEVTSPEPAAAPFVFRLDIFSTRAAPRFQTDSDPFETLAARFRCSAACLGRFNPSSRAAFRLAFSFFLPRVSEILDQA